MTEQDKPDEPMTTTPTTEAEPATAAAAGSSSAEAGPSKKPEEEVVIDEDDFSQRGDITGDGGVWKEILVKGEGWQRPENGDEVEMHYKGTLLDGVMFDSSYERAPFSFKLGDGKVIRGWDIAAKTMAKGEKAKVTLRPEYGYGKQGSPPKIPSNATLVFEMELISWSSKRDVYDDGTVIKSEIDTGDGWERPGKLAEVTCKVLTALSDGETRGKVLNESERTFALGTGVVPEVWDKVIQDMKKGARVQLVCKPPHIGGPSIDFIPEGTKCIEYDIELVEWLKVEDIHGDGTLVKKVLREGDGWERPKDGSSVKINATYSVIGKDTEFCKVEDSKFVVGDGDVVDGIDKVVQTMKTREKALITIDAKHAFKSATNLLTSEIAAEGVSIDDGISVELEVIEFEKAKDMWSMSFEEKAKMMEVRKKKGNELIKVGRNELARKSYERAVAFFDSPTSELDADLKKRVNTLLVQCHLNLAICNNRLGDRTKIIEHCKKALEIEPGNIKALYRRGCAYLEMDEFYSAESDLKYAMSLDKNNMDLRRKHVELRKRRAEQDKRDRELYSNMFSRLAEMEEKEMKPMEASSSSKSEAGPSRAEVMEVETMEAEPAKAET